VTRRLLSVLLAFAVASPPARAGAAPALGQVAGTVTVAGRPLAGVDVALVDLASGAILRARSASSGAFSLRLAPGEYVLTTEGAPGLMVARGPAMVPVKAGGTAVVDVELLPLAGGAPAEQGVDELRITHQPVGCLLAGEFPRIDAGIEPGSSVAQSRVYFRSALASTFYFVPMTPAEEAFTGKLPRPKVEASPIVYYIGAAAAGGVEVKTAQYSAMVVNDKAECPDGKLLAAIGGPGAVQVYSAATGAAVSPAGFAVRGLALGAGVLGVLLSSAAAAGISASVDVFNPQPPPPPPPPPTPTPTPTPSPTPRPTPTPIPTPTPTPKPTPTPCVPIPPATCFR
jgi:hypothetical protein